MEKNILSQDEINELVEGNYAWSLSIAKNIARAWGLDFESEGLDGAAAEALLFCARRYDPEKKVPFKAYARRRIHEAASEAAKKSRGWIKPSSSLKRTEKLAREISAELFDIFPTLRAGNLPTEDDSEQSIKVALQQLLISAALVSTKQGLSNETPEDNLEYKRVAEVLENLEPIHQELVWKIYWEGYSLRGLAEEWDVDPLNVIREHQVLLEYLQKFYQLGKKVESPKVRPGLRDQNAAIKKLNKSSSFQKYLHEGQNG